MKATNEFRNSHQFESSSNHGRRYHVIDEKCTIVRQENATPLECVVGSPVCDVGGGDDGLNEAS
jgi:hypothetical protein